MTNKNRILKVRVSIVIEIDRDAYDAEYGSEYSAEEIRESVKSAVLTAAATDGIVVPAGIIISADAA